MTSWVGQAPDLFHPRPLRGGFMAPKKQTVSFTATKKVKEPTDVKFRTKSGKKVSFEAEKPVSKKVPVKFKATPKH
jgi:hypothetical protein